MANMIQVTSRNLSSVGYDAATSTLYVSFHSGGTYAYFGVPANVYSELMQAPSKGQYHRRFIKFSYPYHRL